MASLAGAFPTTPVLEDVASLQQAVGAGLGVPELVLIECAGVVEQSPGGVRARVLHMLESLQAWLADERLASSRLVVVTRGAVAGSLEEDVCDLGGASVWGLVRGAQSENPGRLVVIDVDGKSSSWEALAGAPAIDEPQMAVRDGVLSAPRLTRMAERSGDGSSERAPWFDSQGTILITGGTGGLGAAVARHLAVCHEARHLLLVSRSGLEAAGAVELTEELLGLGTKVRVLACDVSDRGQVEDLLAGIPDEHPLTAVVHAAGVLDDGVIDALSPDRSSGCWLPRSMRLASARADTGDGPSGFCVVLVGGRSAWQSRSGQLCGGECVPRWAGAHRRAQGCAGCRSRGGNGARRAV